MREIVSPLSGIRSPFGGRVDPYKVAGFRPALVADMSKDYFRNVSRQTFDDIFTTSRLGNATMVDSDGLLKWGPHNLLTYSNAPGSWANNDKVSVSGNTVTADAGVSVSNTRIRQDASVSFDFVFEAKMTAGTHQYACVQAVNAGASENFVLAIVDLAAGTIGQTDSGTNVTAITPTITADGDGYVVKIGGAFTTAGTVAFQVLFVDAASGQPTTGFGLSGSYTWAGTETFDVEEVHLYRSDLGGMAPVPADARVAGSTTYVPTTSTAKYLPRRHNHVYDGSAWVDAGTLIETEARTNLIAYSEDFTSWVSSNSPTVTGNAATSPDGSTNATALLANGTSGFQQVTLSPTLADSTDYCFSVYFKAAVGDSGVRLALTGKDAVTRYFGALSDGSLSTPSGATNVVIAALSNGWYRLSGVLNSYSGATAPTVRIYMTNSTGGVSTMVSGDGIYLYGAQLEAGSTPSSYIPTAGSSVTRAADSPLTVAGADVPWPTPTVIGDELVTNGGFDTDTSGWSGNNATLSSVSGQLVVTPTTTNPTAYAPVTLVVGKVYLIEATLVDVNGSPNAKSLQVGTGATGNQMFSMSFGTTPQTLSGAFVATATTGYVNVYNFDGTNAAVWDNISVKEINPLSVCIQMEGDMTYADDGAGSTVKFLRWEQDSNNLVDAYLRTDGTATGGFIFRQKDGGVSDVAESSTTLYSPGINQAFNIASRHGSTFINGAVDGTALTEDTTPVALPDLSSTDLQIAYDFMGNVKQVRVWAVDIGDTGIAEASS